MKKIIALILTIITLLVSVVACKAGNIIYSYDFTTSNEFWRIMNDKTDYYDKVSDYYLYKWGGNLPIQQRVITKKETVGSKKYWTFDRIYMTLTYQNAKFGELTMVVEYFVKDVYKVSDYKVYTNGGYEIKYVDKNYSTTVFDYYAYYYEGSCLVKFYQRVYKTSVAGQNNYSVEDFLSHIPSILDSKYKL